MKIKGIVISTTF